MSGKDESDLMDGVEDFPYTFTQPLPPIEEGKTSTHGKLNTDSAIATGTTATSPSKGTIYIIHTVGSHLSEHVTPCNDVLITCYTVFISKVINS